MESYTILCKMLSRPGEIKAIGRIAGNNERAK
jgi:hypothetical protein